MAQIEAAACIWDIDHTLYHATSVYTPSFPEALMIVLQKAGVDLGATTLDDLRATITDLLLTTGTSYPHFSKLYNVDTAYLASEIPKYMTAELVLADPALPPLFAASRQRHVINTHADPVWTHDVLTRTGLRGVFAEENIVYHARHGFEYKSKSAATHKAALALTQCDPRHVVMIDDMEKNLRIPKEMGMRTVMVASYSSHAPSHVDAVVNHARDVFNLLAWPADTSGVAHQSTRR